MNISIIIATRNRALLLHACLTRLIPQLETGDELIVVDNASTDHTALMVKSFSNHSIRYIYEPRVGASWARNTGFMHAKGQGVAFLDDDSLITPSWLHHVRTTLIKQIHHYPNTIYQGKITQRYLHHGTLEKLRFRDFRNDLVRRGMHEEAKLYNPLRHLLVGNIFSYRSVFAKFSGPFSAKLFPFIGEGGDLAYRCIQQGTRITYIPTAEIVHTKTDPVTITGSIRAAYGYGRTVAILELLYFSNERFLFQYYARPVQEGHVSTEKLKDIETFSWNHPLPFIHAKLFYLSTACAYASAHVLHKYLLRFRYKNRG